MPRATGTVVTYPARASFAWYFLLIAVGAGLLMLPFCRQDASSAISWLDAAFTATSATCVTGLEDALSGQLTVLPAAELRLTDDQLLLALGKKDQLQQLRLLK